LSGAAGGLGTGGDAGAGLAIEKGQASDIRHRNGGATTGATIRFGAATRR